MRLTGPAEIVCKGEVRWDCEGALVKPAALRLGATLAVVSPASTPKAELVHRGMERSAGAWV